MNLGSFIYIFFFFLNSLNLGVSYRDLLCWPLTSPPSSSAEWPPSSRRLGNSFPPPSPRLVASKVWRSSSASTSTPPSTSWSTVVIKSSGGDWSEHAGVTVRIFKERFFHWHWWHRHHHIKITSKVWTRHVVPFINETSKTKIIFYVDTVRYTRSSEGSSSSDVDRYAVGIVRTFKMLTSPSSSSASDWYTVGVTIVTKVWNSPSTSSDWGAIGIVFV